MNALTSQYFSLLDILSAFFWLGILLFITSFHYQQNKDKEHYRYYRFNIFGKFFFAMTFSVFYLVITEGGDTTAYFDGANALVNLFVQSPSAYFNEMISSPDMLTYWNVYDVSTGFPPGWIYREEEGFFISKIISLFSFVTFKSYLATTFIIAFLTAKASWKLFSIVLEYKLARPSYVAFAILFIPSVNFWCTGISKDSFVFISICYIVYYGFKFIRNNTLRIRDILFLLFFAWIAYNIRPVILAIVLIPLISAVLSRWLKNIVESNFLLSIFRTLIILIGIFIISLQLSPQSSGGSAFLTEVLAEASVIQQDFAQNELYGENRYDLGPISFTFTGLIRVIPIATFTGAFRPMIWEALSPSLILNGLESLILIFGLLRFIFIKPFKKARLIRSNEFLYFCLLFVFLMSFATGLTSGLYGVLVRLRAPLLPFLFILMTVDFSQFGIQSRKKARLEKEKEQRQLQPTV